MDTLSNWIGAARTAICVRKEIASRKDEMINIWRVLSVFPERGVS